MNSSVGSSNINAVFGELTNLMQQSSDSMQKSISDMSSTMKSQGGTLDPMQTNNLQMLMQSYTAFVTTFSSITKQIGDLNKQIASNIGA